jgi:hypothetical protein
MIHKQPLFDAFNDHISDIYSLTFVINILAHGYHHQIVGNRIGRLNSVAV